MEIITKIERGRTLTKCEKMRRGSENHICDTWIDLLPLTANDYGCYTDGKHDYWPLYRIN